MCDFIIHNYNSLVIRVTLRCHPNHFVCEGLDLVNQRIIKLWPNYVNGYTGSVIMKLHSPSYNTQCQVTLCSGFKCGVSSVTDWKNYSNYQTYLLILIEII